MMKALIGSMMNLMNQNGQIIAIKEKNNILKDNIRDLEDELATTKVKVFGIEYDLKELRAEK